MMRLNNFNIVALFFIFFCTVSYGQDFAPVNAKWYFPETFAFSGNQNIISFHSIGDSIIDNKSFRIIEKDKWSCLLPFSGKQLIHQRNDSIFHLNNETNDLNLIIDFGALPGEDWFVDSYTDEFFGYSEGMQCFVDSIGSMTINSQDFKLQYVTLKPIMDGEIIDNYTYSTMIIENIGFRNALFPVSFQGICDGNYEGNLRCYEDDNIGLISFSPIDCLSTSTYDIAENDNQISIYPLPIISEFSIDINNGEKPKSIAIYDLSGKRIFSRDNTNKLNVSSLNNGVYFVKVKLENGFATRKIVIAR